MASIYESFSIQKIRASGSDGKSDEKSGHR